MEATMGAFSDEDWDSLGKIFFSEDAAADLMLQFHGDAASSEDDTTTTTTTTVDQVFAAAGAAPPSLFWPVNNINGGNNYNQDVAAGVDWMSTTTDALMSSSSDTFLDYTPYNPDFQNISQESSNSTSASDGLFNNQSPQFYQANFDVKHLLHQVTNDRSMDFCLPDDMKNITSLPLPAAVMEDIIISPSEEITMEENSNTGNNANVAKLENEIHLKRKFNSMLELQIDATDGQTNIDDCSENTKKKKSRVARNAPKTKKNVQPKSKKNKQQKDKQIVSNEDEEPIINTAQNGQSSTCYSSEDDSNASQESNIAGTTSDDKSPALNLNGKTRATRGAATDPQSLYARRRRERINERLRILQNLIPNGTKVDISTMLEEAVHYVKFLQLQIKLLSSDDMWMYAPIVYNGLDIGLFGRIFPTP